MQFVALEKSSTTKLFWFVAMILIAVMVLTAKQSDPGIFAAGIFLALMSLFPLYLWLLGWSHGLPIWPVFVLATGVGYSLPVVQGAESLAGYTAAEVVAGVFVTAGFILLGSAIWISMTLRVPRAPRTVLTIEQKHAVKYLMFFVWLGVFFGLNFFSNWIILPGNLMSVVRGISMSLNTMGLFVLAYYHGRGLLNRQLLLLFVAGTVATALVGLASLMIAQAIIPTAMVILGYMLGSNKLPWRVLIVVFLAAAILHPGKYEMRRIYWEGEEGSKTLTLASMPQFFSEWVSLGLNELGGLSDIAATKKVEGGEPTSVFDRSGSLHMLLLVMRKTPSEVPFFEGATYAPIPRLLIPRFIDDEKGISHAGNVMLTVNYGLQTLEQTQNTSICWGLLAEAYANFGYLGIAGLAVVLAIFFSLLARMTVGVPLTSLRFVLGLLVMAAATRADTMGIFVTMQFQGMIGVSLAAMVLMKRQINPFAADGAENGGRKVEGRAQRPEVGERRPQSGEQKSGLKLTNLRPKTAADMPRRSAPWMTHRMRQRLRAAE